MEGHSVLSIEEIDRELVNLLPEREVPLISGVIAGGSVSQGCADEPSFKNPRHLSGQLQRAPRVNLR